MRLQRNIADENTGRGMMDESVVEYIKKLLPEDVPNGRDLVNEGREIGRNLTIERNGFLKKHGYRSYLDYRKSCVSEDRIVWQLLLGLSTLEEELDALRRLDDFANRTGMNIRTVQSIPSMLVALPEEYWDKVPRPTSYVMRGEQDWMAHAEAAPIQTIWQDWHLSSPNNLKTTQYALKAGSPRIGTFSQFIWDYPGYTDEIGRFSDMVRSLGIIASKRDDYITADTYPEDGLPGYFLDVASYVGYMLVEQHIIERLCGARMSISYGGLLTEIMPRMAFGMAMHKLLGSLEEPILSYYNGGTLEQWDHDINANFGTGVQEMLIQILVERRYKMHTTISPVSVTEKLRVPTFQELLDIAAAGNRAEEKAHEWLPMMNFDPLERLRDDLILRGRAFFDNVMESFTRAGVDTEDPLQMILVLKRFSPIKFESSFHPQATSGADVIPYHPSVLGRQTMDEKERIVLGLRDKGYSGALQDRKVIVASADGHSYGLLLVETVMNEMNATVVNGGVDMEPETILDLADEEGTDIILVSVHCGQVLDYCRQLVQLIEQRTRSYHIFVGGMLNALLPGHTEPVDVTRELLELGVYPSNDLERTVGTIREL